MHLAQGDIMTVPSSMRDRAYLAWGVMLAVNVVVFILVSLWTTPREGLAVLVVLVLCSAWVLSAVLRARARGQEKRNGKE